MNGFFGKLNFVHRQLWRQDTSYRVSILLGPAALAGFLLAGAAWLASAELRNDRLLGAAPQPPNWAIRPATNQWDSSTGIVTNVNRDASLPPVSADGSLAGFSRGWEMSTGQLEVNALDATLLPNHLTSFSSADPNLDMATILANGPKNGPLYLGVGSAFLVIRTAGIYGLSAQLARPAAAPANCLTRLAFGGRRVVSTLEVGLSGNTLKTYEPIKFDLQPGLYRIVMAFGCWHDREAIGPGSATVMIAHPGERDVVPATAAELVRPEQRSSQAAAAARPGLTRPAAQ